MKKAISVLIVLYVIIGCVDKDISNLNLNLPKIESKTFSENKFGVNISDDFRFLENENDTVVKNWYIKHSSRSKSLLDSISQKDSLLAKMLRYADRSSEKIGSTKITDDEEYYYLKRLPGENKSKLYYRKSYSSKDVLIYDPANYKALSKEEYSINYYNHSWDNKYVVISLSSAGKEISDLIIFDTQRKVVLEEVITNAWPSSFLGVQWLPDNSGFTFLHFTQDDPKANNFKMNTHSVLYKIGDSPNKLKRIFGSGSNPELKISRKGVYPIVQINHFNDKYIIGYLADVDNFWSAYYAPINELNNKTINWKPFFSKEQKIETNYGDFKGDKFMYKSARLGSNCT
jgi:prolyl oligopeptidase